VENEGLTIVALTSKTRSQRGTARDSNTRESKKRAL